MKTPIAGMAATGLAVLLAGGLEACCFGAGSTGGNGHPAADLPATPPLHVQIVGWGPHRTRAGVPFNAKRGHARLWIKLDRSLAGRTVLVQFDDAFLEGHATGRLVTAIVPEESYAEPGDCEVRVLARSDGARWSSNKVMFTVE
jgi:hypothetical protein